MQTPIVATQKQIDRIISQTNLRNLHFYQIQKLIWVYEKRLPKNSEFILQKYLFLCSNSIISRKLSNVNPLEIKSGYSLEKYTSKCYTIHIKGGEVMAGKEKRSGRKKHQKMKPFLIYEYLLRESDEEHPLKTKDIIQYLEQEFDIAAEARSIYRDVQEINRVILALQEEISLEEADGLMEEDDSYKTIRHHKRKGFYVTQRKYDEEDIRLLAECVYAAAFVDEKRAKKLADIVFQFVSTHQAERMDNGAIVKNRVKTSNTAVYYTVNTIHDAIGKGGADSRKIKFQYLKHTLQDVKQLTKRQKGADYIVTPYALIIDNGYYYLLGYDEKAKDLRTYRVDRMTGAKIMNEHAIDDGKFEGIDLERYTKEHFGMFGAKEERITLRCTIKLLESMIDRFGTDEVTYVADGKGHFSIRVTAYTSDQFFGWVAGFGNQIKITSPASVREEYVAFLRRIEERYTRAADDKQ